MGISVVVPSQGRVELLGELIETIVQAQGNYPGPSELIIVDDSNEEDAQAIGSLCAQHGAKLIYHSPSVSAKRNLGAQHSQHEIVLFLDSDCLATPGLLSEHAKLYCEEKVGGVLGLLEFVGEDTWFWKAVNNSPFVICFGFPRWLETVPWGPSANLSVRKALFIQLGGFDETFPNKPGGEDVDLGLRITKMGLEIACTKEGLVYHSKKTWIPIKDMIKRLWHYGSADYYLMVRHPDYTIGTLPRRTLIYLLGLFVIAGMAFSSPILLALYPLWILTELSLTALMINLFSRERRASFLQQLVTQLLIWLNELGFMYRCLSFGNIKNCFKQMVYFTGQLEGIQYNGALNTGVQVICFVILLFVSIII